jgi:signal transduction histidine kinase
VDATELLGSVARRFHTRAVAAGRELVVRAPAGLVLSADALRLEQAVANLVDNALRHGEGAVTLRALEAGATVELHVEDEGRGFPVDFLPRAFERFSRADDARSRGGSGLGLALVRAIATAHGGTAHASNREQGGADVSIALPRSVDAPAVAAGALIRGSSPAPTVGSSTDAAGTRP